MTETLVLLATLIAILAWFVNRKFTYWQRMGVPCVEPKLPFGNMQDLFTGKKSFGGALIAIHNQLKQNGSKFGGMYFFARPILVVIDPEMAKSVMQTDFNKFVNRSIYSNEKGDPLSSHLLTLEGTKWKNLRAKLSPTFTSGKMKYMFPTLVDCGTGLVPLIDSLIDQPLDIKDVARRYTTDVIGSCAFGIECNSLKQPDNDFRRYGKRVFEASMLETLKTISQNALPHSLLRMLNMKVVNAEVSKFFMGIVKETVEYRERNNVRRKDFMNLLLQLKNRGKVDEDDVDDDGIETGSKEADVDRLTLEQIAAQSFIFYNAGFETASTTITFCLFELTQNMDIQEKVRQEINAVLEKHQGKVTYEGVREMKYMERVVQETLRMHPPLPFINRLCNEDYKIPDTDVTVSAGTQVFIVNEAMQMDPEHFPEPERFDPDRFTEESKATRHPFTYLPFGEGPRHCIGLRFGMMQTKVGLMQLLRNYRFTLNSKTKTPLEMKKNTFFNAVEGDIWLNAEKIRD